MVKQSGVYCDICGDYIPLGTRWLTFLFSPIRLHYKVWGMTDINPPDSGWVRPRLDLCGDCKQEVFEEVESRVNDE